MIERVKLYKIKGRVALEPILFTSNFWRGKNWQKFRKVQILAVVALDQHDWAKTSLIDIYVMSRYLQSRKHLAHWLCKNGSSYTDDCFRGFRAFVEFCVSVSTEQRSVFSIVDALTIRGFRPIIGPAVFPLLVTTSRTLLSFFLCCHLCCCFHHCYCFPHLESKRAKETDLLPCLQGTEIVLPPSLRYWIGAGSWIQGRSHRHFEKTAARVPRFHYKNHRKKGQMDREKNNFVPTSYVLTCTSRTK